MRFFALLALLSSALLSSASGQTQFEAASIRVNPPQTGFHFGSGSATGGPGSPDPGLFRCTGCTLADLISKAFELQTYQFPERASLGDTTFDIQARVPEGATHEDFQAMLRNLLKDRFALTYHFKEKTLRGYHLVVAAGGPKLRESAGQTENDAKPAASGRGETHAHSGAMTFGGSSIYRASRQTTADIARVIADQLRLPVDDRTGLKGLYDIALNWAGDNSQPGHADTPGHAEYSGGRGDHGAGAPAGAAAPASNDGPALFEALQSQLGLKLVPSEQTTARILAIDHVERLPTAN